MESTSWLSLTEYALKNNTSISTLRRKIKSNSIVHKMEDGRYLIKDEMAQSRNTQVKEIISPQFTPPRNETGTDLHLKALDARVGGLARKVDLMAEQLSELKMLVQIFEEKLEQERTRSER